MNQNESRFKQADKILGTNPRAESVMRDKKIKDASFHSNPKSHEEAESELWLISYADLMTLLVGFFAMILSFSKIDANQYEKMKKATTQMFGGEYKIPHEQILKQIEELLKKENLTDQVVMNPNDKGIDVTFRGALFFDSGSAELKPEALLLMEKLIPILKDSAGQYSIVIEGHTDDNAINSSIFPSNWELSSYRASSVLRLLEKQGFAKERLKAVGWGDTRPILPNRNPAGLPVPENQNQNRRVVLKIMKGDVLHD